MLRTIGRRRYELYVGQRTEDPREVGLKPGDPLHDSVQVFLSTLGRHSLPPVGEPFRAVICDIDGTVALKCDRDIYDYSRVKDDLPNVPIVRLVQLLGIDRAVIFVSGREDGSRPETTDWLKATFDLDDTPALFMRRSGDYREDAVVKKEIYETYIRPFVWVDYVIDDRNSVVAMWRSLGLTCLQVADGDF